MQQPHAHGSRGGARFPCGVALAAALALTWSSFTNAAAPSSPTLSLTSGPVSWDGFASAAAVSPDGEATCVEGTSCDTFTLTLAPGDYRAKRCGTRRPGRISSTTTTPTCIAAEEDTFDVNAVVTAGSNDIYTVHVVYYAVVASDPYHGVLTVEPIPVITTPTRTAKFVTGPKTGIGFSRSRALYAVGAGQDVETSARVDYQGNAYVGGIRGLTGGNDLWRFDLNPASPTYDPFLTAATPQWSANGTVRNLAWKGQPDALAPNNESELGGDGGGDLDMLNALQKRGAITNGTVLMGLRGSSAAERNSATTPAATVAAGFSDSTRAGATFTMGSCQP